MWNMKREKQGRKEVRKGAGRGRTLREERKGWEKEGRKKNEMKRKREKKR